MTLTTAVPALPVRDVAVATAFYCSRLGFAQTHVELTFAVLERDQVELHLWQADDRSWEGRTDLASRPVRSGAESFLAGTASCRLRVDSEAALAALHTACGAAGALHPVSANGPEDTTFAVRQFHVLDVDGNLVSFFTPLAGR